MMASLTAFLLCLIFGPPVINWLKKLNFGQNIRKEHVGSLYDLHKHKQGTPTMGGVLIILAIGLSTILWADIANVYVLLTLVSFLWLGLVGFTDDYIKVVKKRSLGLTPKMKLLGQIVLGIFIASMGLTIIFNPEVMKKMIAYWKQGKRIYAGGLLRALFGVIFLLSVPQARLAAVMYGLGILVLISALIVFAMGLEKIKVTLDWWDKKPSSMLRIMGLLAFAIGFLIIYSA